MSNFNNQNKKTVFLGDTAPIVSEILKKYGLEEEDEDIFEKIEQGKPCLLGGIILDIVIELAQGKILKKELVVSIQKYLNIPKEKAKKMAEDIEKKLLTLVEKVPKEKAEVPTKKSPVAEKSLKTEETPIVEEPKTFSKKEEPPQQEDTYRESIE